MVLRPKGYLSRRGDLPYPCVSRAYVPPAVAYLCQHVMNEGNGDHGLGNHGSCMGAEGCGTQATGRFTGGVPAQLSSRFRPPTTPRVRSGAPGKGMGVPGAP
jgi:hypothetical protein